MYYTFSEIRTQIAERIGKTDSVFLGKIDDWINGRYDQIIRVTGHKDLIRTTTATSTTDVETMTLPQDVSQIINIHDRTNDSNLAPIDASQGGRIYIDNLDTSAIPTLYWVEESTVQNQPTAASTITMESSSASDTSQIGRMWGRTADTENEESGTLNGTSTVNLLTSCTEVNRVSLDAVSVGFVTFKADAGATTVAVIYPRKKSARYKRIHLVSRPSSAIVYNIVYKTETPRLEFDEDVPVLNCWNALVIGGYADALKQQRRFSQSQVEEERYASLVADMINESEIHSDNVPRTVPHIEADFINGQERITY